MSVETSHRESGGPMSGVGSLRAPLPASPARSFRTRSS